MGSQGEKFTVDHSMIRKLGGLLQIYRMHEDKEERLYLRRILDVDHGTFTPLVFTTAGGMGDKCLACQNNNLTCPMKISLQLCQAKNRDELRVETVKGVIHKDF